MLYPWYIVMNATIAALFLAFVVLMSPWAWKQRGNTALLLMPLIGASLAISRSTRAMVAGVHWVQGGARPPTEMVFVATTDTVTVCLLLLYFLHRLRSERGGTVFGNRLWHDWVSESEQAVQLNDRIIQDVVRVRWLQELGRNEEASTILTKALTETQVLLRDQLKFAGVGRLGGGSNLLRPYVKEREVINGQNPRPIG